MKTCACCGRKTMSPLPIPATFLMQNAAFNLNTCGFVRVQVIPARDKAAKSLLSVALMP